MVDIRTHAEEHTDDIIAAPGPEQEALAMVNAYQDAWNTRDFPFSSCSNRQWPHQYTGRDVQRP